MEPEVVQKEQKRQQKTRKIRRKRQSKSRSKTNSKGHLNLNAHEGAAPRSSSEQKKFLKQKKDGGPEPVTVKTRSKSKKVVSFAGKELPMDVINEGMDKAQNSSIATDKVADLNQESKEQNNIPVNDAQKENHIATGKTQQIRIKVKNINGFRKAKSAIEPEKAKVMHKIDKKVTSTTAVKRETLTRGRSNQDRKCSVRDKPGDKAKREILVRKEHVKSKPNTESVASRPVDTAVKSETEHILYNGDTVAEAIVMKRMIATQMDNTHTPYAGAQPNESRENVASTKGSRASRSINRFRNVPSRYMSYETTKPVNESLVINELYRKKDGRNVPQKLRTRSLAGVAPTHVHLGAKSSVPNVTKDRSTSLANEPRVSTVGDLASTGKTLARNSSKRGINEGGGLKKVDRKGCVNVSAVPGIRYEIPQLHDTPNNNENYQQITHECKYAAYLNDDDDEATGVVYNQVVKDMTASGSTIYIVQKIECSLDSARTHHLHPRKKSRKRIHAQHRVIPTSNVKQTECRADDKRDDSESLKTTFRDEVNDELCVTKSVQEKPSDVSVAPDNAAINSGYRRAVSDAPVYNNTLRNRGSGFSTIGEPKIDFPKSSNSFLARVPSEVRSEALPRTNEQARAYQQLYEIIAADAAVSYLSATINEYLQSTEMQGSTIDTRQLQQVVSMGLEKIIAEGLSSRCSQSESTADVAITETTKQIHESIGSTENTDLQTGRSAKTEPLHKDVGECLVCNNKTCSYEKALRNTKQLPPKPATKPPPTVQVSNRLNSVSAKIDTGLRRTKSGISSRTEGMSSANSRMSKTSPATRTTPKPTVRTYSLNRVVARDLDRNKSQWKLDLDPVVGSVCQSKQDATADHRAPIIEPDLSYQDVVDGNLPFCTTCLNKVGLADIASGVKPTGDSAYYKTFLTESGQDRSKKPKRIVKSIPAINVEDFARTPAVPEVRRGFSGHCILESLPKPDASGLIRIPLNEPTQRGPRFLNKHFHNLLQNAQAGFSPSTANMANIHQGIPQSAGFGLAPRSEVGEFM